MKKDKNISMPPLPLKAEGAGEEFAYDKDGEVVRLPLFRKLFLSLVIILVAGLSFGLGRLSVTEEGERVKIEFDESLRTSLEVSPSSESLTASAAGAVKPSLTVTSNTVMASKNGTRYHFLYCASAKQIKEENKIVFPSPEAAEGAGYTLALNCQPR